MKNLELKELLEAKIADNVEADSPYAGLDKYSIGSAANEIIWLLIEKGIITKDED